MAGRQQSCAVFVLGASGKLGRMVCSAWAPRSFRVVPVLRSGPVPAGALHWVPGGPVPPRDKVRAIVALWGVTPGPGKALSDNTRLALAAMDLGERVGADVVLHCSSAAVYRSGPDPLSEQAAGHTSGGQPPSDYGRAKLDMERAIAARTNPTGPRQIVMRIGNVAGADSLFANLAPAVAVTLDRFPDGDGPARSYIAAKDLASVIEALILSDTARGIYNISAPVPTKMADLVYAASANLIWREAPQAAAQRVWLDTGKLQSVIDIPQEAASAEHLVQAARIGGVWP